jgi:hypothetical protein
VFMRVNSKCAHQVRPPFKPVLRDQAVSQRSVNGRRVLAESKDDEL